MEVLMICNNVEMRKRARQILGGSVLRGEWLYAVLIAAIVGFVAYVTSMVSILIAGILGVGSAAYFLSMVRGEGRHDDLRIAVDGAQKNIGGACITGLLVAIYTMLWSMLFIIPGIVKGLSYSMAYYVRVDNPELSATEAINESKRLMEGHKWQLFCLGFSFVGWFILGTLCFGIGILWASAYMQAATAVFYQELLMEKEYKDNEPEAYDETAESDKSV